MKPEAAASNRVQALHHHIGGRQTPGSSGRTSPVHDPSSGMVTAAVPLASRAEVEQAIAIADKAFPAWAQTPPAKRAEVLFAFRELVRRNMDELAALLSSEHGKTVDDAKGSISRGLEVVDFACGIPQLLKGDFSQGISQGVDCYQVRQPLGVCAGITPFNFPAMVPMWMFPIAIACGNSFVLKPSEKDPSTPLRLAELLDEAGLPPGVFNVVNGDKEAVDALLADPRVQSVSFVGSTAVGEYIYREGCAHGKRVQALCGAKNHAVVMPDADLDNACDAIMGAAYGSAGERCMAISAVVAVGDETGDLVVAGLKERIARLKVGPGSTAGVDMGPLITAEHQQKVLGYIDLGVKEGAEIVVDGRGLKVPGSGQGFFVGATLFDRVKPGMRIHLEEIFGPVLVVLRAPDYEAALALVSDHAYGNGATIFTEDGASARDFAARARIGMIGVNVPIPVPVAYYSFGGWKSSLFGDHHMHGPEGVHFFTRMKTVTSRWPSSIRHGARFHFRPGSDS